MHLDDATVAGREPRAICPNCAFTCKPQNTDLPCLDCNTHLDAGHIIKITEPLPEHQP